MAKKIKENDSTCPECGSEEITGGEVVIESGEASQKCFCNACESSWFNVYKFSHIQKEG